MATLKILLYKSNKNKHGQFSLALRITKDGKPKYIHIEWLEEKYWNAKKSEVRRSHPFAENLNSLAKQKHALTQKIITEHNIENRVLDIDTLVKRVKNNRVNVSFFDVSNEQVETLLKREEFATHIDNDCNNKRFKKYIGNEDIGFHEIQPKLIKDFIAYLEMNDYKKSVIKSNLSYIRKIFNIAIRDKVIPRDCYPFGTTYKYKIKGESPNRIGLVEDELMRFASVEIPYMKTRWLTQQCFLFSFYLAGIRVSDVIKMKWNVIHDGRLYYEMGKNQKRDSLQIPEEVLRILEHLKPLKTCHDDYIFPFLKGIDTKNKKAIYQKIKSTKNLMNYHLKIIGKKAGIEKNVSCHIARHTFGTIAGNKISMRSLQKLYRHSDINVTMGYQRYFDHSTTDKALQDVVSFSNAS
ncbi:tyrosine-type recombinase/integrase [Aquimarina rhabdastrellae]